MVGSDKIYAIENFYAKYLAELGETVSLFPAQSIFFDTYQKSVLNKILFKTGVSNIYRKINQQLRAEVMSKKPGIVWVFKGMELYPGTLQWLKDENIKVVSYNPDNPFLFSGSGSGNKNISASIGYYDLHFTYNLSIKKKLEEDYHATTAYLPFGFDVAQDVYEACARQEEVNKVCFLGNPDSQRAVFINSIAGSGIPIDVYGNGWRKFARHANITSFGPVYADGFWKTLRRYRVQLNMMRIHNNNSHNMRTFEIPGIGGIQVAPDTPEHRMFFDDGREIFLYRNVADCIGVIQSLLQLPVAEAGVLRVNARARSIKSGYTYHDRAVEARKVMNDTFAKNHADANV